MTRKRLAAAVVLGGLVATAGSPPAAGKDPPPEPVMALKDVGELLLAILTGDVRSGGLMGVPRLETDEAIRDLRTGSSSPKDAVARVSEAAARIRFTAGNRLREVGIEMHDRIATEAATNAEGAALGAAGGAGSPSDVLQAGERRLALKLDAGLEKSYQRLGKALDRAGSPTSLVIPGTDTPLHPYLASAADPLPQAPLLSAVGYCDGEIVVHARDPAAGQPVTTSFLRIREIGTGDLADSLELTSSADFSGDGPSVFRFAGLPPGTYLVLAGVTSGGASVPLDSVAVTVPACDPPLLVPTAELRRELSRAAFGGGMSSLAREEGDEARRAATATARGVKDGEVSGADAMGALVDLLNTLFTDVGTREAAAFFGFRDAVGATAMSTPDYAEWAVGAGLRTPAETLRTSVQRAEADAQAIAEKGVKKLTAATSRAGTPIALVLRGLGDVPHPAALSDGTERLRSPFLAAAAAGDGSLSIVMRDPAAGRGAAESTVEVAGPSLLGADFFDPVADRRIASATDFASGPVQTIRFTGLVPGNYGVRAVVLADGVRIVVDTLAITVPAWGDGEPPPPACTVTSFTATIGGSPFAVPPLASLRVQVTDGKFYGMSLRYADTTSSIVPQFNFLMSPHEFVDVADLPDSETVITKPPTSAEALSYFYFPSQIKFTSEVSATYRIRNLGSFVRSGGCASVDIDGVYAEWQGMTQVPFSLRLTMSAADVTQ